MVKCCLKQQVLWVTMKFQFELLKLHVQYFNARGWVSCWGSWVILGNGWTFSCSDGLFLLVLVVVSDFVFMPPYLLSFCPEPHHHGYRVSHVWCCHVLSAVDCAITSTSSLRACPWRAMPSEGQTLPHLHSPITNVIQGPRPWNTWKPLCSAPHSSEAHSSDTSSQGDLVTQQFTALTLVGTLLCLSLLWAADLRTDRNQFAASLSLFM